MKDLSADHLREAATIKDRIEALEKQLSAILGGGGGGNGVPSPIRRGRPPKGNIVKFSAERGGGLSAAGRLAIARAARKRWAAARAAGKNHL